MHVKTSEYNYIIKTIILSLLIRKPRLFSIHFCTKKLLEYFLIIDTYYDSEERDKKFLISSRMGHAFGRISVDLYREAADTLLRGPVFRSRHYSFSRKGAFSPTKNEESNLEDTFILVREEGVLTRASSF